MLHIVQQFNAFCVGGFKWLLAVWSILWSLQMRREVLWQWVLWEVGRWLLPPTDLTLWFLNPEKQCQKINSFASLHYTLAHPVVCRTAHGRGRMLCISPHTLSSSEVRSSWTKQHQKAWQARQYLCLWWHLVFVWCVCAEKALKQKCCRDWVHLEFFTWMPWNILIQPLALSAVFCLCYKKIHVESFRMQHFVCVYVWVP